MRSSFRDRTRKQRGYVLVSAIALAILYFALMQLMLIDSSHALQEANRFRARIVASALAENAAELAAANMINQPRGTASYQDDQGKMIGSIEVNGQDFEINARGDATGVVPLSATVRVQGRIQGTHITVDYTYHSQ